MVGNLNAIKETPDDLLHLLFLLVLIEIKKKHIEELREQLQSNEETNVFHLHSGTALIAEFMLRAALENEFQLQLNLEGRLISPHMISNHGNQKKEDGLDHQKAQKEVLYKLKEQLKIPDTLPDIEIKRQLKSRLQAYFDSREPFFIVHQYEESFAIPYLVEFLGLSPTDYTKLPEDADLDVTLAGDSYLDELLSIIYKKIMKRKSQDSL
jgi:hypothetical protein